MRPLGFTPGEWARAAFGAALAVIYLYVLLCFVIVAFQP